MNLDNDYDNDGNNIVPCPICLSVHCPSKEDGECPDEFSFALEGEIRLLLDEYKETGDNSRIVNVLETVDYQLQKAREEEKKKWQPWVQHDVTCYLYTEEGDSKDCTCGLYHAYHSEIDQEDNK